MPLRRAQVPRHDAGAAGESEGRVRVRQTGEEGEDVGEKREEEMKRGLPELNVS
jgi:hypothetical protein